MTTRNDKAKQQFNCIKHDLDLILSYRGIVAKTGMHIRLKTARGYNAIGTNNPRVSIVADHSLRPTDIIRYVEGTGLEAIQRHVDGHKDVGTLTLSEHLSNFLDVYSDLGELVGDNYTIDFNNQLVSVTHDGKIYQFSV